MNKSAQHAHAKAVGLALKGSQRQLQMHVNVPELCVALEARLCGHASAITPGSIEWRSPLLAEGYREYSDRGFVEALGRPDLAQPLGDFWPRGGPVWDGLATFLTPEGETGALLVEAKAHAAELRRGGTLGKSVAEMSRRQIERSLADTRDRLGVDAQAQDWTVDRYQSANRLAHALWVGGRMPTVLAHILFHDDRTHREESEPSLMAAAREVYRGLGFASGPPAFAATVSCPGADPLALAPSALPEWASQPFELAGFALERRGYPPDFGEHTRPGSPVWALVGSYGFEHDEIAVAALPQWLELSTLAVRWDGHEPVVAAKPVQRIAWREFPPDADVALAAVNRLARGAARRRRSSYRRCAECNEWVAPEHRDRMAGRHVCHGCQERHHGIVH